MSIFLPLQNSVETLFERFDRNTNNDESLLIAAVVTLVSSNIKIFLTLLYTCYEYLYLLRFQNNFFSQERIYIYIHI